MMPAGTGRLRHSDCETSRRFPGPSIRTKSADSCLSSRSLFCKNAADGCCRHGGFGMAFLSVERGSCAGRCVEVVGTPFLIGRHLNSDLVFEDETISRRHARILRTASGYEIEDLHSRNGTMVNGEKVVDRRRLKSGDTIGLFDVVLKFLEDEAAQTHRETPVSGGWSGDETAHFQVGSPLNGEAVAVKDPYTVKSDRQDDAEIQLQAVLDVTRHISNWLDLDDLYDQILGGLFRVFPQTERACVLRLDQATRRLVLDAGRVRNGEVPGTLGPLMLSIVRRAFKEGKSLVNQDVLESEGASDEFSIHDFEQSSVMCAPLIDSAREPLGAIYLDTNDPTRPFAGRDLDMLACVAILASQAVEQETLHNTRYRAVVDTSVDAIITFNEHGTIESINPAAVDLFAYGPGELRGMNIATLVPELASLTASADKSSVVSLFWTFQRSGEATGRRSDHTEFPVRVAIGEFELRGRKLYTATLHDITEQIRVENTLKTLNDHLEKEVQRRTGYVQLLQDVAVIANETDSVSEALQAGVKRVCEFMQWESGHVYLQDEEESDIYVNSGIRVSLDSDPSDLCDVRESIRHSVDGRSELLVHRVLATGEPCFAEADAESSTAKPERNGESPALRPVFSFPIVIGDDVVAVAEFSSRDPSPQRDETLLSIMSHVGTQLGRVIERHRLQRDVVDAVWHQQRQFGQELHDTVGQELTGICMMASSLARRLTERNAPESERVRDLASMLQHAKQGTRRLAKGLLPVEIDSAGLQPALEELGETTRDRCEIAVDVDYQAGLQVADNSTATHLFRIAQEAVTNAVKHARARRLVLSFTTDEDGASCLRIIDDGSGIQRKCSRRRRGVGLRVMRFRAAVIGATLTIQPGEQRGTSVICRLPGSHGNVQC
ncbi:MAG: FHA domain-containing protein [Planctomycetota bacterium]|nr:MAG: FHA domain-containing protein [Planctomycetota bacterium]